MIIANFFAKTLGTFFYIGYLPFIPGTFGSIAGLVLFYLFKDNIFIYLTVTVILIASGFLVSGRLEKIFNKKDPSAVVIDEVSGMLVSLAFLPHDPKLAVLGFFIFRLLDTVKPYPIDKFQDLKGSSGVMCDDLVAALYTNIILQLVVRLLSFKIS